MTSLRTILIAVSFALPASVASAAPAGAPRVEVADASASATDGGNEGSTLSLNWMPSWLAEAFGNAIADATDPRDRHEGR